MPKRYEILYLSIAERDLTDIFDYLYKDNPSAAASFLNTIDDTITKLADFPEMGKFPNDSSLKNLGYRMLIIEEYIVFYVIKKNGWNQTHLTWKKEIWVSSLNYKLYFLLIYPPGQSKANNTSCCLHEEKHYDHINIYNRLISVCSVIKSWVHTQFDSATKFSFCQNYWEG